MIEFSWKELIFLALAIISAVISIIQGQKKKSLYKPIKNDLVGLFNAIKSKQIYYYTRQKTLESGIYAESDSQIKNDFSIFIQEILVDFEGIKEHLVAALKTMSIRDREIFKASDFGLTDEDKKQREEFFKKARAL